MADHDDAHLKEVYLGTERILDGRFLHAVRDTVRLPDGKTATREYIKHMGAVGIVPILDDGRIVMERQYRHAVGGVMTEIPAGKLDPGEDQLACAQRELLEETGYVAREWAYACAMHPTVAYADETLHIWFARGLTLKEAALDEGEFLEVITATPEEYLAWCRDGVIRDSKSLIAGLWVQNVLVAGTWKLDWQSLSGSP